MDFTLTANEARVIGALIEKQITTPDQYPLSLNALTLACNQKSNRDPVMSLDESTVLDTLNSLASKHLIMERSGRGSRVVKYQQRMVGTEFSVLNFTKQEIGAICVMLLRGPQTPGEIRTRTNRLCQYQDVSQVESVLNNMASREDGPYVVKLPREAGRRESRYAHLLSGEVDVESVAAAPAPVQQSGGGVDASMHEERIALLEAEVEYLKKELDEVKETLGSFIDK